MGDHGDTPLRCPVAAIESQGTGRKKPLHPARRRSIMACMRGGAGSKAHSRGARFRSRGIYPACSAGRPRRLEPIHASGACGRDRLSFGHLEDANWCRYSSGRTRLVGGMSLPHTKRATQLRRPSPPSPPQRNSGVSAAATGRGRTRR